VVFYPGLTPLGSDSFGPSGLVWALQARWNALAGLNEERLLPAEGGCATN